MSHLKVGLPLWLLSKGHVAETVDMICKVTEEKSSRRTQERRYAPLICRYYVL